MTKEKNEIRLVTFQDGQSNRLIFSDFLVVKEELLYKKLPVDVVYDTKRLELDVKFIVTSSFSEFGWSTIPKSQRLCDIASFVIAPDYQNKLYIELGLSAYTQSITKDDWDEGRTFHVFDLHFDNETQKSGHKVRYVSQQSQNKIELVSDIKGTGIFNASISAHRSYTIDEYKELTKIDPFGKKALEKYFNPEAHAELRQKIGFNQYIKIEKNRFNP